MWHQHVAAGFYSLSGNGELTGTHWIDESGCLVGPVATTNTLSVGAVHEEITRFSIPLVHWQVGMEYISSSHQLR